MDALNPKSVQYDFKMNGAGHIDRLVDHEWLKRAKDITE